MMQARFLAQFMDPERLREQSRECKGPCIWRKIDLGEDGVQ